MPPRFLGRIAEAPGLIAGWTLQVVGWTPQRRRSAVHARASLDERGGGVWFEAVPRTIVSWLATVALTACAEDVRRVDLAFIEREPNPFSCVDGEGEPLVLRATDRRVSVVFDVVEVPFRFSGVTEILRECRDPGCPTVPELRRCYEIVAEGELASTLDILRSVERALEANASVILDDVPDVDGMIRTTVSTEPCDALRDGAPPVETLVACALTRPVDLGSYEGVLELDLPTTSLPCTLSEVALCATLEELAE